MKAVAAERRRFDYRRIHIMLDRQGIVMNQKKLRDNCQEAVCPNDVWATMVCGWPGNFKKATVTMMMLVSLK